MISRALLALSLTVVASPRAGAAQGPDTLRVAEAIAVARAGNPMLGAAHQAAAASAAHVSQAGALPDPQLQFGLMNRMASDFGSTMDPMTMNQVQVMQMIPWPGRLSAAREAARHRAAADHSSALDQERMLDAQVRMAYYDLAYMDRALAVMDLSRKLLRQFREVSATMYAVGNGIQQDVLRADVEVARMGEEISRMQQERVAGVARFNALLGREPGSAVGALELPEVGDSALPPVDTLVAWALASRPALQAQGERAAAAEAALTAARRELLPDISLGFAYQQRPAFPDMISIMFGVNLPLFAGSRQLPMRDEMTAMRDMSRVELTNARNETAARVIETRARVERDRNLVRLYRVEILPQARAAVEAALGSYRVGRVSFMTLIDDQMTVNSYDTETYRLIADYHQALGELEALVGPSLEEQ